ncbi:response regulator transcription factor [Paenibacillus oenotherae]|uniref:Response regulator transcription factor n=1 Tax=Paenibacillus oenotherae TaxID=1435645 RepID=A0ABS7DAP6_9BACL|nr:response regulator transcription factor [Paenibacillus oenotherae]MBW7476956.1 response regulator transcription factor [Paenibacillus oenotherae]
MTRIKVMLVEDDEFWVENICRELNNEKDIEIVKVASTKDDAVHYARENAIDTILMDINLSSNNMDGIEAVKEINSFTHTNIIMLTNIVDTDVILHCFEHGAINYISKSNIRDMVEAIRDSVTEGSGIHPDAAEALRKGYQKLKKLQILTSVEREVYELKESGFTVKQIASRLHKSFYTVKNQLSVIRNKLNPY